MRNLGVFVAADAIQAFVGALLLLNRRGAATGMLQYTLSLSLGGYAFMRIRTFSSTPTHIVALRQPPVHLGDQHLGQRARRGAVAVRFWTTFINADAVRMTANLLGVGGSLQVGRSACGGQVPVARRHGHSGTGLTAAVFKMASAAGLFTLLSESDKLDRWMKSFGSIR